MGWLMGFEPTTTEIIIRATRIHTPQAWLICSVLVVFYQYFLREIVQDRTMHFYGRERVPMAGKMNVNLFHVHTDVAAVPLPDLLTTISQLPLLDRIRALSYGEMRLDYAEPPRSANNASPFWLLDFVKLRFDHGPGKVGKTTLTEGFDLNPDEGFGEETAVLYDADSNHMVVQYNHHGVRASAIERYLNIFNHNPGDVSGYTLAVKLDPTSEVRLAQKNYITKLHFKVAPAQMTAAHRRGNVGVRRALAMNDAQGGNTIEVTIAAAPREHLLAAPIMAMIESLKNMVSADQQDGVRAVAQFEVDGKVDLLDRADGINMISPKLEASIDGLMLGGDDRRYTRRSRWDGLIRARRGWNGIIG